jgi:hypothetical protein
VFAQPVLVHVAGEAKLGNFHLEYADLQIPLAGIPITKLIPNQPGMSFTGPAIIEESGATVVIHPGNQVEIDGYDNIHIHLTA